MNKYYCYILASENPFYSNHTYNGSTNNLTRRLRQHNQEITGVAKSTKNKGPWKYIFIMEGFTNRNEALSYEWRIKHPTGKRIRPKCYCGIEGRIKSLNLLLNNNFINNNNYKIYIIQELIYLLDNTLIVDNVEILNIDTLNV